MQAQLFFFDNTKSDDYRPSTSIKVISNIRTACIGYFEDLGTSVDPKDEKAVLQFYFGPTATRETATAERLERAARAIRASRVAGAGDAKLTEDDIRAWDELVREQLLPWHQEMIDKLKLERDTQKGHSTTAYDGLIDNITNKMTWIDKTHMLFMESFEEALELATTRPSGPKI